MQAAIQTSNTEETGMAVVTEILNSPPAVREVVGRATESSTSGRIFRRNGGTTSTTKQRQGTSTVQLTTTRVPSQTSKATTSSLQSSPVILTASTVLEKIEETLVNRARAFLRDSPNISTVVETDLGTVKYLSIDRLQGNAESEWPKLDNVLLTRDVVVSLPAGTAVGLLSVREPSTGNLPLDSLASVKGEKRNEVLAAQPFEISILDANGQPLRGVQLSIPLVFKLAESVVRSDDLAEPTCVFLETLLTGEHRWSTRGVRRATPQEVVDNGGNPDGLWCVTTHLSLFSALAEIIVGCLNAELLHPDAMSSIAERDGWWRSRPSVVVITMVIILLLCLIVGCLHDYQSLEMGRTNPPKRRAQGPGFMEKIKTLGFIGFLQALLDEGGSNRNAQMIAGVQRCLAVRSNISHRCIASHCWHGGKWVEARTSLPHAVLREKLQFFYTSAEDVLKREMQGRSVQDMLKRFGIAFLALHPLLDALRLAGGSLTCAKRVLILLGTVVGTVAANAFIYNFSGAARGWESSQECTIEPASTGYIILVSVTSVILNTIPNLGLLVIAIKAELRQPWEVLWWLLYLLYSILAGLVVLAALANLNPLDEHAFHAGLEYAMIVKLLLIPLLRAFRVSVQLERVIFEDKDSRRYFLDQFGHIDLREKELSEGGQQTAENMAKQAITAEQLLNFYAMLGNTVMPSFDPKSSTSDDVIRGGIISMSFKAPDVEDMAIQVGVANVSGLHLLGASNQTCHISCSVLHLSSQQGLQLLCLEEYKSSAEECSNTGNMLYCTWNFEAALRNVELEDSVAFAVSDRGRIIGISCLPMEQMIGEQMMKQNAFSGELPMYRPEELQVAEEQGGSSRSLKSLRKPSQAGQVAIPATVMRGSRTEKSMRVGLSQRSRLGVWVNFPKGFLHALAQQHCRGLKDTQPGHCSEVQTEYGAQVDLMRAISISPVAEGQPPPGASTNSSWGAFAGACSLPPDRVVVHSRQGNFLHFVTSLLVDAMDERSSYESVRQMLLSREYHTLLDKLRESGHRQERYWIDMFATDLILGHKDLTEKESSHWHEELVYAMPTILRTLKRSCCQQLTSDIAARREPQCRLPVQVLILDPDHEITHASGCLAEMMIARQAKWTQRLILHPGRLYGPQIGDEMKAAQRKMQSKGFDNELDLPWTSPYLRNKEEVYGVLSELVVSSVAEQRGNDTSIWAELHLVDIYTAVGAAQISQTVLDGAAAELAEIAEGGL